MSGVQEKLKIIRWYRDETGKTEIDMHDVAQFAVARGHPLPAPKSPLDRLAAQFSRAARQDYRDDPQTGNRYRVNHAYSFTQGGAQRTLWTDIDAPDNRRQMAMSATQRREQMLGDVYQLTLDLERWNAVHPDEEPLKVVPDFGPDIEWKKNAPGEDEKAS